MDAPDRRPAGDRDASPLDAESMPAHLGPAELARPGDPPAPHPSIRHQPSPRADRTAAPVASAVAPPPAGSRPPLPHPHEHDPRSIAAHHTAREVPPRRPKARPDPNPLRTLLFAGGVVSASAILTALLPSVAPRPAPVDAAALDVGAAAPTPAPSVRHVTRFVVLQPGQTAPPQAPVVVKPTPTPHVKVVTVTRQSGTP